MRNSTPGAVVVFLVMSSLLAGNVQAGLTERLEGEYLKSRVKLRIDEGWKVQTGNVPGAQATACDDAAWATTNVPHDMSITLTATRGGLTASTVKIESHAVEIAAGLARALPPTLPGPFVATP